MGVIDTEKLCSYKFLFIYIIIFIYLFTANERKRKTACTVGQNYTIKLGSYFNLFLNSKYTCYSLA